MDKQQKHFRILSWVKYVLILITVYLVLSVSEQNKVVVQKNTQDAEQFEALVSRMSSIRTSGMDKDQILATDIRMRQILNQYEICNGQRKILDKDGTCVNP